jgi:hypothetical protein
MEIEKHLRDYIDSCIESVDKPVKDSKYLISIVSFYDKDTDTYRHEFAYVWASEIVFNILINGCYIDFTVSDLEEEIKKLKSCPNQSSNSSCPKKISWADISDDDNDNFFYQFHDEIKQQENNTQTNTQISQASIEVTESMKRKIWEEKRAEKTIKVSIPRSDDFKFKKVNCISVCMCHRRKNPKIVLQNAEFHKKARSYNKIIEYISYVKIYKDFEEYPKIENNESIYAQFPEEEILFAVKFFTKLAIYQGRREITAKFSLLNK